jgi:nitroimidazol reductase NimA-like FMN-containing flavoprotein (pyridoxamine 5'-phosphate oxidase superfamily)
MIEVKDMAPSEVESLLNRVHYGHLGCASNNHPYVVPIHFAYDESTIYVYTTEGKKSKMIDANPEVCLQVEKVIDNENWASVIVIGDAKKLDNADDREEAYAAIAATNPTLTPAISFRWLDNWVRENKDVEVVYRIDRKTTTGRKAGNTDE